MITFSIQQPDARIEVARKDQPEQIRYLQPSCGGRDIVKLKDHINYKYNEKNQPSQRNSIDCQVEKYQRPDEIDD